MDSKSESTSDGTLSLVVRRTVTATVNRVFAAWTRPEEMARWWGPRDVRCGSVAIDLRVDGRYEIVNILPDSSTVVIHGRFLKIEAPHLLVYSWSVGAPLVPDLAHPTEQVTVRFLAVGDTQTEIVVVHERIATQPTVDSHTYGWLGCLDGLDAHLAQDTLTG
ncbi:MAG: hypothetical protein ACI9MR_004655 [Myxococcota bacterium]|jgi:uncharacterized protein YndB with AHSA1/START domain